ncbi:MAG TPA: Uma2 family endonuclease [Nostocaceae cyanobacterium]|nr:Uma2 family endonuclease [Nostocaceae cyanobacterium]
MSLENDFELPEDIIIPPTDLWSDEPIESDIHRQQINLLIDSLNGFWCYRQDLYISGNLTIYYKQEQLQAREFCSPDFFVVLECERKPRKSWVVWGEDGKMPDVVIEILSERTAAIDKGLKKQIYQNILRVGDYFWFDPYSLEFAGFHLVGGKYQPIAANSQGWLWSHQLELYLGIDQQKLRFFTADGELVLTEAEFERQQKELAQKRVEILTAQLKTLGVEPEM